MERIRDAPITIADRWRRRALPLALSLALHLLLLLLALGYLARRQVLPPARFLTVPVEIFTAISHHPGAGSGTPAPHRPARAAAKRAAAKPVTKPVAPPEDPLTLRLRELARLGQGGTAALPGPGSGTGNGTGDGGYTLKDFVRAQILRRWLPDLSGSAAAMPVTLRLRLSARGVIDQVVILDQARMKTDPVFFTVALAARDAAILSSPLHLPRGDWPPLQTLTITLDPQAALH